MAATRWLDQGQQRSWRAFVLGTTLVMEQLDQDLRRDFGISMSEYEILVRLSEAPDRTMRMARLAAALCHSRSRVTHTIGRMEHTGLVTRAADQEDGRGVQAKMTDTGFALLEKAAHVHVEGVRRHLVDLCEPDDFAALGRVMDAVTDKLIHKHPEYEMRTAGSSPGPGGRLSPG